MTENEVTVTQALEPCPFCGAEGVITKSKYAVWIACTDCFASDGKRFPLTDIANAIASWNTRAQHRARSVAKAPEPDKLWSALNSALRFAGSRNAITAEEEAGIWAVWNSTRSVGEDGDPPCTSCQDTGYDPIMEKQCACKGPGIPGGGWCAKCGCGNDVRGYAHLAACPASPKTPEQL